MHVCSKLPGLLQLTQTMRLAAFAMLFSTPLANAQTPPPAQQQPTLQIQPQQNTGPLPQNAPEHKPGVFESFGRWFDESATNMRKGFDDAWKGMGKVGNTTADVAKGTADAAGAVTKGAVDAAKGTADAFGKLGASRFVNGRELCAIAPNGAPDCKPAAVALCKANGYATGDSVDYVTAESCPTAAYLNGRKPASGECPIEHTVTRALCQ